MGYFSNGTEAELYQAYWCHRCVNWKERVEDEGEGCPVMDLHFLYGYDQIKDGMSQGVLADILTMLIPQVPAPEWNGECTMFQPADVKVERIFQEPRPEAFTLLRRAKWTLEEIGQGIKQAADAEWEHIAETYEDETADVNIELAMGQLNAESEAKAIGMFLEVNEMRDKPLRGP